MTISIALFLIGSYLLGSIPFGLWIVKWLKGIDVRTVGSGNIGATNVSRICGPAIGRLVFVLDLLKGLIPPLIGRYVLHVDQPDSRWIVLAARLAILGHNFSIFLGFQGGKGISTSGGALLGAAPKAGLGAAIVFIVFLLASSTISVGSLAAAVALPLLMFWLYPHDWFQLGFGIVASLMAIFKHRKNVERLRNGTEPRVHIFGKRQAPPAAPADSQPEKEATSDVHR
jgi:glycerol-3-phosphate acyltransferase PlsY